MSSDFVIRSRARHRPSLFGLKERLVLALTLAMAAGTIGLLFMVLRDEQSLRNHQAQLLANRDTIKLLETRVSEIESSKRQALPTPESIRRSLVKFEHDILDDIDTGQSAVVLEVNQLARKTTVSLTEVTFNPIEQRAEGSGQLRAGANQGIFPGMELSFTVQGSYRSLRDFLSGLESSHAFLVINTLDLKSVDQSSARPGMHGNGAADRVIALGVNLSVYYSRASHG